MKNQISHSILPQSTDVGKIGENTVAAEARVPDSLIQYTSLVFRRRLLHRCNTQVGSERGRLVVEPNLSMRRSLKCQRKSRFEAVGRKIQTGG